MTVHDGALPSAGHDGDALDATRPSGVIDFAIYTASMELGTHHGSPVVSMIGSSTVQDLEGDTMLGSALDDMTRVAPGMTIWLNHKYELPDDLFGSLIKAPSLEFGAGIADLRVVSDVELSNPAAARTHKYIEKGRKLGCSIGARVDAAHIDEDLYDKTGRVALLIDRVTPVEWSVVGIPCNQRSWVENAVKGYSLRMLSNPGTADERVASLLKSLWPKEFDRLARSVTHDGLRKMLWSAEPSTRTASTRIVWDPPTRNFKLSKSGTGVQDTVVDRDAIAAMLATNESLLRSAPASAPERASVSPIPPTSEPSEPVAPTVVKADDADKDKKAQKARASKYGISVKDPTHVTKPGKWSDVPDSEWGDPVNYNYPMKDAAHARNALSRWGDADNRAKYSKSEQGIVGARIKRRAKALGVTPSDDD